MLNRLLKFVIRKCFVSRYTSPNPTKGMGQEIIKLSALAQKSARLKRTPPRKRARVSASGQPSECARAAKNRGWIHMNEGLFSN